MRATTPQRYTTQNTETKILHKAGERDNVDPHKPLRNALTLPRANIAKSYDRIAVDLGQYHNTPAAECRRSAHPSIRNNLK